MSSTAAHMARDFSGFDVEESLVRSGWGPEESYTYCERHTSDDLVSRALASAGIAALVTLPFLLLSSLVLNAPLAVPAAIGLGYIAVSRSLTSHQYRRAAAFNAAVLLGLISWLMFFLIGDGPPSGASVTAALLAPLFAAAPALARALLQERDSRRRLAPSARDLAVGKVASLDELAPTEIVLLLDSEGIVLAATATARKLLGLLPDAFEHSLAGLITSDDLPRLLDGIGRCRLGGQAVELSFEAIEEGGILDATLVACGADMVAMKLRGLRALEPSGKKARLTLWSAVASKRAAVSVVGSDVREAVAYALDYVAPKAKAKKIKLSLRAEPGLAALCDQRTARRMACLLFEASVNASISAAEIGIAARRLRGVILLRTTTSPQTDANNGTTFGPFARCVDELQKLAERVGGTVMVEKQNGKTTLSLRLLQARCESGK